MKSGQILKKSTLAVAVGAGVLMGSIAAKADVNPQLQEQRIGVLAAAQKGPAGLPALVAAMKSPNAMIRRAAARSMGEIGIASKGELTSALKSDPDPLVRRTALRALTQIEGNGDFAVLQQAMSDSSDLVRQTAVQALASMHPYSAQITTLLKNALQDPSNDVAQVASQALWPFHKDGISLRDEPEFKDSQLSVAQTIPLPDDGWKFQKDPSQTGQEQNWFGAAFNDSNWDPIKINVAWDGQIGGEYDGVGWYRRSFTLPAKPAQVGTDIVFDGVDESGWVWINGQYLGQHDIGLDGWDKRFAMDASDVLKWGQENQITVRVLNRKFAGGIWKPVYFEVLKK